MLPVRDFTGKIPVLCTNRSGIFAYVPRDAVATFFQEPKPRRV